MLKAPANNVTTYNIYIYKTLRLYLVRVNFTDSSGLQADMSEGLEFSRGLIILNN